MDIQPPWLEVFIDGLAEVFREAAEIVLGKSVQTSKVEPEWMRRLDPLQRLIFAQLTLKQGTLTTSKLRELLPLSDRSIRDKINRWREEGFIVPRDSDAQRVRSVKLTAAYKQLAQAICKAPEHSPYFLKRLMPS